MLTVSDQTKRNTSVHIDGLKFVRVHFINCELIYLGRDEVDFEDCTFDEVTWRFSDAAVRTLGFLATLNAKTGNYGVGLVDGIVNSVKNGRVTELHTEETAALAS